MRLRVYNWLYKNGPSTAGEVTDGLKSPTEPHPSYHRRLDELGEQGLAKRIGEKRCKVTGRNVVVWQTTDLGTPMPYKVRKTKANREKELIALVERVVTFLERPCDITDATATKVATKIKLRLAEITE